MWEQDAILRFIEQKKRRFSWDGHRELDVLTKNLRQGPRLQGPQLKGPELQDGIHVPEGLVERMEKTMNAAVVPKYGGSNELDQPPTIFRVTEELKRSCKQAFLPVAVELGLFARRYQTASEHALQEYNWCCVRRLISRHHLLQVPERTPALLRRCLDTLKRLEPRIRSSYHPRQQRCEVSSQVLMCNMLLDGCFILHRLLKYAHINRREAFPVGPGRLNVTSDLLLLENQVGPFLYRAEAFRGVAGALCLFRSIRPQRLRYFHITCHEVHHLLATGKPYFAVGLGLCCRQSLGPTAKTLYRR